MERDRGVERGRVTECKRVRFKERERGKRERERK